MSAEATSTLPNELQSALPPRRRFPRFFSRRLLWTLVCLISALVLYYRWEDWRGARELAAAWERLLARTGTADVLQFAPPEVPDEQNFFALPVIEHWAVRPLTPGSSFKAYDIPDRALLPVGFISPKIVDDRGIARIDFEDWQAQYAAQFQPVPSGATPAVAMDHALGDGNGLIPQLVAGLDRPFSRVKPGWCEALEAVGDQPWLASTPWIRHQMSFAEDLAVHHRAAAHAGNTAKVRDTALIMLRWSEASLSRGTSADLIFGAFITLTANSAVQDSLSCGIWEPRGLKRLQMELQKYDELELLDRTMCGEALVMARAGAHVRRLQGTGGIPDLLACVFPGEQRKEVTRHDQKGAAPWNPLYRFWLNCCPAGVHDANAAFAIDNYLSILGPRSSTAWIDVEDREGRISRTVRAEASAYNPRRMWGRIPVSMLGATIGDMAELSFARRCLIVACTLENYRLKHDAFPVSLQEPEVQCDLAGYTVGDPAHLGQPMSYRLQEGGYLLWTGGQDGVDDGGLREKDWLWRMRLYTSKP